MMVEEQMPDQARYNDRYYHNEYAHFVLIDSFIVGVAHSQTTVMNLIISRQCKKMKATPLMIIYLELYREIIQSSLNIKSSDYNRLGRVIMDQEVNISAIQRPELMEEEYPDHKNDIFEEFLIESLKENDMEIEKIQKPVHSRSSKTLNRRSDFRKILNSSSSNERLIPSSIKNDSSRENSEGGELKHEIQNENSLDSESFRKSFKKKFEESFSVSHTIRDSSSEFSERSDSKSSRNIIIIPRVYDEEKNEQEEVKLSCNCKRSRCLKLYCDCFQKKMFCSKSCNCQNCGNHIDNKQEHQQAIIEALARNAHTTSHGFDHEQRPEQKAPERVQHQQVRKGCKCKKTKCLKKYCECYQNGQQCTIFCRCEGCYNKDLNSNNETTSLNNQFMQLMKNI